MDSVTSINDLVAHALIGIDQNDAVVCKEFIGALLAQNLTAEQLVQFWSSTLSAIFFKDGETVRKLIEGLLARFEEKPYAAGKLSTQ